MATLPSIPNPSTSPTPAALIGIAVDVSGSMQTSIQNQDGGSLSRFHSFRQAVSRVVQESHSKAAELARTAGPRAAEALVFAYAFGMSQGPHVVDLLALLKATENVTSPEEIETLKQRYIAEMQQRYASHAGLGSLARRYGFGSVVDRVAETARASAEKEIRDRITGEIMARVRQRLNQIGDTTLTISELAAIWAVKSQPFDQAEHFIFGSTPMRECLEKVATRFENERSRLPAHTHKLLILVGDGEPTDGDPTQAIQRIKDLGVFIASCFVTNENVAEPRHLYGQPSPAWGAEASLMFQAASVIEEDLYREFLEGHGWRVENNARLFAQVNHSEILEEFLTLGFARAEVCAG